MIIQILSISLMTSFLVMIVVGIVVEIKKDGFQVIKTIFSNMF